MNNSDWTKSKLGDLLTFKNGLNKGVEFFGHGTPIVNYMDVNKNSFVTKSSIKGLVEVTQSEKLNCGAQKGDIFFTRTSETLEEIGLSSVLIDEIDSCVFSGYVLRGRPKVSKLLPEYCKYCFRVPSIRKEIMRKSSMTTRALTNGRFLSEVDFTYPVLNEQKWIVSILETWDDYLRMLDKKIEFKKNIQKGLLQQLLTNKLSLHGYGDSWRKVSLNKIGGFSKGAGITKDSLIDEGLPAVRYGELYTKHHVMINTIFSRIPKDISQTATAIIKGDILFAGSGETIEEIGKSAAYMLDDTAYAGGDIVIFRANKANSYLFLAYLLNSASVRRELRRLGQGQSVVHIYKRDLEQLQVAVPSKEEQSEIAEIIRSADEEINGLIRKKDCVARQKKYLLNNLITGKIRVPDSLATPLKEASYA